MITKDNVDDDEDDKDDDDDDGEWWLMVMMVRLRNEAENLTTNPFFS